MNRKQALTLLKAIKKNGGFTLDSKGNFYTGKGYAVATIGNEKRFTANRLNLFNLAELIKEYRKKLTSDNLMIGAWLDGGKVFFDISEIVQDKDQAIQLGKERKQLAIFNFSDFSSITL
jgi:hypothetical protein